MSDTLCFAIRQMLKSRDFNTSVGVAHVIFAAFWFYSVSDTNFIAKWHNRIALCSLANCSIKYSLKIMKVTVHQLAHCKLYI